MSTTELLLYGLIVAGVLLFNYVMRQLALRARQQQSEPSAAPPRPLTEEAMDYSWGRQANALPQTYEPAHPSVEIRAASIAESKASGARLHPAARRLLADRRELRHAIVLMTLLGPCRAHEPYDERDRGSRNR